MVHALGLVELLDDGGLGGSPLEPVQLARDQVPNPLDIPGIDGNDLDALRMREPSQGAAAKEGADLEQELQSRRGAQAPHRTHSWPP